jgi:hypothetical protein
MGVVVFGVIADVSLEDGSNNIPRQLLQCHTIYYNNIKITIIMKICSFQFWEVLFSSRYPWLIEPVKPVFV